MPTYAYRCKKCHHRFERTMRIAEHEERRKPQCPKCRSRAVEQVPGEFQAMTKSKT